MTIDIDNKRAIVKATLVRANTLKPGDLYSTVDNKYWSTALDGGSLGERVYIRTNVASDDDAYVYRVTIKHVRRYIDSTRPRHKAGFARSSVDE